MENENETPNPASSQSPLESALKQLQTWFVEGQFEKVKQGCQEVLQAAPHNSIAQDLFKKAEEGMSKTATETDIDTAPAQSPKLMNEPPGVPAEEHSLPPPFPESQPTKKLKPLVSEPELETEPEIHHGKSIAINIAILIAIILIGIAGVYAYDTFFRNTNTNENSRETTEEETLLNETEEITNTEEIEESQEFEENEKDAETTTIAEESSIDTRNEERLSELTQIETALIKYYESNKRYPEASEVGSALLNGGFLEEIPVGPLENEVYLYAVFDNELGENQVYILTAVFENPDGSTSEWTTGGSIQEFPDYNNIEFENVTILHPTLNEADYLDFNQNLAPENTETERVPRS